ncbi:hypothetical protein [Rhizobium tibeticum]|uniref:hypothetical protein n=1 Tax=Rhizobium tibeticum TaxID=501024 RepID=UPI001428C697|nr:hypothetical protein [Rhizobium tibeticum]
MVTVAASLIATRLAMDDVDEGIAPATPTLNLHLGTALPKDAWKKRTIALGQSKHVERN